jgi:acetyl esterase/lipase
MTLFVWFAFPALSTPLIAQERPPEIVVEEGVVYGKGGGRDLKLNLARPKDGDGPFPMIVCIHDGGWIAGKREDMATTIEVLARRGYIAVTLDYRLAPDHRFPAPIEDCKAAVRWLRANAKKYHGDADHIGVLGTSAGGHLACLLGVTDKADGLEGTGGNADQSSRVQAVVSFSGPTDLASDEWGAVAVETNLMPLLGGPLKEKKDVYRKASPSSYSGKGAPPFLLFHGSADRVVPLDQTKRFAEKLDKAGAQSRVILVEGAGHGLKTWKGDALLAALDQTMKFFDSHLKK